MQLKLKNKSGGVTDMYEVLVAIYDKTFLDKIDLSEFSEAKSKELLSIYFNKSYETTIPPEDYLTYLINNYNTNPEFKEEVADGFNNLINSMFKK